MLISEDTFGKALLLLQEASLIAIDTETYWTDNRDQKLIIGCSTFCKLENGKTFGAYFPFRHETTTGESAPNLPLSCMHELAETLNGEGNEHIFHNRKFDQARFLADGIELTRPFFCTMVMSHMFDENNSHKLEDLAERFKIDPTANARQKQLHALREHMLWHKIDLNLMAEYAVGDVHNTYYLYQILKVKLEKQELTHLIQGQMDYSDDLMRIENRGIRIDPVMARKFSEESIMRRWEIERLLGFDPGKQLALASLLFGTKGQIYESEPKAKDKWKVVGLGLPVIEVGKANKRYPDGAPLMNEGVINKLAESVTNNPVFDLVLEYRGLVQADSFWYKGWPAHMDSTKRLHPTFNQHGTVHTRLSCNTPNVQQIPRDIENCPVKKLLLATEGYELWEFDYSQLEYRIITSYCGQTDLVDAYRSGSDFHTLTSNKLTIPRHLAKNVNFTLAYLGGPGALRRYIKDKDMLGLRTIYNQFHEDYRQLVRTAERVNQKAAQQGYIKLWTGHRCRFKLLYETKKAWNRVIAGGGAQIVRVATYRIMRDPELATCFINSNVHDALWVEIPVGQSGNMIPKIVHHMRWPSYENQEFWKIPFEIDYHMLAKDH